MNDRTGALLIPGLGGTQFALGTMHKVLQPAGVTTYAVTLLGHDAEPGDFGYRRRCWRARR